MEVPLLLLFSAILLLTTTTRIFPTELMWQSPLILRGFEYLVFCGFLFSSAVVLILTFATYTIGSLLCLALLSMFYYFFSSFAAAFFGFGLIFLFLWTASRTPPLPSSSYSASTSNSWGSWSPGPYDDEELSAAREYSPQMPSTRRQSRKSSSIH